MKFSLELKNLSIALSVVVRAVAGKDIRPILANILILAANDELRLIGTDLEIIMIARLPAEVESECHFTIPAKLLSEVIGAMPVFGDDPRVTFELPEGQNNKIQLSCGSTKYDLQIQGIEDFPPIPTLEGEDYPSFEIASADFKRSIREAAIAMGAEDSKPSQRCICMNFAMGNEPHNGQIVFVATDSKRLAVSTLSNVTFPPEFERTFLLPARAEPELLKLLDDASTVTVGLFSGQLIFTSPKFQLLTRLIDAKFPDYSRVLPKECSRTMTAHRKDLQQALKAIFPIAKYSSSMVHLDIGPNETRIWAESKEQGLSECFLPTTLTGEPLNIAFNIVFLLEFLAVLDEDSVVLEMTTPSYPGLVRTPSEDRSFKYVVMPMTF